MSARGSLWMCWESLEEDEDDVYVPDELRSCRFASGLASDPYKRPVWELPVRVGVHVRSSCV